MTHVFQQFLDSSIFVQHKFCTTQFYDNYITERVLEVRVKIRVPGLLSVCFWNRRFESCYICMNNIFCLFPPTMVLLSSCLSCVKRFVSQVSCLWHQILQSGAQYLYHTSVRGYILFWNKQSFALVISLIGWLKDSKSLSTRSFQIPRFETRSSLKIGFVPGFSNYSWAFSVITRIGNYMSLLNWCFDYQRKTQEKKN